MTTAELTQLQAEGWPNGLVWQAPKPYIPSKASVDRVVSMERPASPRWRRRREREAARVA